MTLLGQAGSHWPVILTGACHLSLACRLSVSHCGLSTLTAACRLSLACHTGYLSALACHTVYPLACHSQIDFATMNGLFTICGLNYRLGPVYGGYVPCSLLSMNRPGFMCSTVRAELGTGSFLGGPRTPGPATLVACPFPAICGPVGRSWIIDDTGELTFIRVPACAFGPAASAVRRMT